MLSFKEIFSGQKRLVGLDIGSSSLKLAEIISNSKGHYLNRFFEIPLPKGIIVDGVLADASALSLKIKEIFKHSGWGKRNSNFYCRQFGYYKKSNIAANE